MIFIKLTVVMAVLAATATGAQAYDAPYRGGFAEPGMFVFGGEAFDLPTTSALSGELTFSGSGGMQGPDSLDMLIYLTEGASSLFSSAKVASVAGQEAPGALVWDFSFNNVAGGTYKLWYSGYTNDTAIGSLGGTFNVTAVPEPESYALLMAGLGVLGFMARRKKALQA